jgi:hypothetical protein
VQASAAGVINVIVIFVFENMYHLNSKLRSRVKFCSFEILLGFFYFVVFSGFCSLVILSQLWLPTVQLVLQADWQVLLHSPQPTTFLSTGLAIVLIIINFSLQTLFYYYNLQRGKNQVICESFLFFNKSFLVYLNMIGFTDLV